MAQNSSTLLFIYDVILNSYGSKTCDVTKQNIDGKAIKNKE